MDGGRRLLRSVTGVLVPGMPAGAALAGVADPRRGFGADATTYLPPRARRRRGLDIPGRTLDLAQRRGAGVTLATLFLGAVFAYGAAIGGAYDGFVARNGSPADIVARAVGFGVDAITITGQRELVYSEILDAAQVSELNSLPFLDIAAIRERLLAMPLVKEAGVRKLYPNRLVIDVAEREPYALWQKQGQIYVISQDGKAIDTLHDDRFVHLPFVVGDGANARVAEFQKIVEAAGDLSSKIRAGVLVTNRRWNLKLTTGVDIKLPEQSPQKAIAALARLAKVETIIDKDLISIDLRVPGRVVARLSEESAAARLAHRSGKKSPLSKGPVL